MKGRSIPDAFTFARLCKVVVETGGFYAMTVAVDIEGTFDKLCMRSVYPAVAERRDCLPRWLLINSFLEGRNIFIRLESAVCRREIRRGYSKSESSPPECL